MACKVRALGRVFKSFVAEYSVVFRRGVLDSTPSLKKTAAALNASFFP
jgi:hypothetical protein